MNVFYKRVLSILLSMCLLFPLVTETVGLDAAEISDTSTIREVQKDAMVEKAHLYLQSIVLKQRSLKKSQRVFIYRMMMYPLRYSLQNQNYIA